MLREAAFPSGPRALRRGGRRLVMSLVLVGLVGCTGGGTESPLGISAVSTPLPHLVGAAVDPAAGKIASSDFKGKVMVVNFWAVWCGPCRAEQPILQSLWQRYRDRGVVFLGVDERDDPAAAQAQLRDLGVTYPSLSDPDGRYATDFGFFGLPNTYVVDRTGTIRYQVIGRVHTEAELATLIDRMLARSA
jgi:cytochrome c biogenesis protein CcmG, thiol:disulfide interchange protein DsbE